MLSFFFLSFGVTGLVEEGKGSLLEGQLPALRLAIGLLEKS